MVKQTEAKRELINQRMKRLSNLEMMVGIPLPGIKSILRESFSPSLKVAPERKLPPLHLHHKKVKEEKEKKVK